MSNRPIELGPVINLKVYKSADASYSVLSEGNLARKQLTTEPALSSTSYSGKYCAVGLTRDGKLFVNVPWTDYTNGTGLSLSGATFSLLSATPGYIGGIKVGSVDTTGTPSYQEDVTSGHKYYKVKLDKDKIAYVDVPWTDTTYTNGTGLSLSGTTFSLSSATSTTLGGVKLGSDTVQTATAESVSSTTSRTYLVQVNSAGQLVVNIPWNNWPGTFDGSTYTL